ncbi:hypothetical protein FGI60_18135 [Brucella haematophila]|nr:hypothetical protein FGI60_18135 [Brucella haematophila]
MPVGSGLERDMRCFWPVFTVIATIDLYSRVSAAFCHQGLKTEWQPENAGCIWSQDNINHTS